MDNFVIDVYNYRTVTYTSKSAFLVFLFKINCPEGYVLQIKDSMDELHAQNLDIFEKS